MLVGTITTQHAPVALTDGRYGRMQPNRIMLENDREKICVVLDVSREQLWVPVEEIELLPTGTPLVLANLIDNPEYNNRRAWVTGFNRAKQKYSCRLQGSYKVVMLPHRAVVPVQHANPPAALPPPFYGTYPADALFPCTFQRLVPTACTVNNWTSSRTVYDGEEHLESRVVPSLQELLAPGSGYWDQQAHYRANDACQRDLELLLERAADPNNQDPETGDTPLHVALKGGMFSHSHAVETLLAHGADMAATNRAGVSVLEAVVQAGRHDLGGAAEACFVEGRYSWAVYCELCRRGRAWPAVEERFSFRKVCRSIVGSQSEPVDHMSRIVREVAKLPMPIFRSILVQVFPLARYDFKGHDFYEEWPAYRERHPPPPPTDGPFDY